MGSPVDGLNVPRDLAFHPTRDELWTVNRETDSAVIFFHPGMVTQSSQNLTEVVDHATGILYIADTGTGRVISRGRTDSTSTPSGAMRRAASLPASSKRRPASRSTATVSS